MTTLQILVEARKLIEKPENWCTEWVAKTSDGRHVTSDSPDAECFCMVGAILRTAGDMSFAESDRYRVLVVGESESFGNFNDTHSHAEVLAAFDRAIEAQRAAMTAGEKQ